jgi:uncharacterized protein YjbJ (UPF0337 family)
MGLFDAIREKAGELLSGATEKVGEVVGDVPGVGDLAQSATDAGEQVTGAGEQVTGAATDAVGQVGDQVTGAAENVAGALPEPPEPYRP